MSAVLDGYSPQSGGLSAMAASALWPANRPLRRHSMSRTLNVGNNSIGKKEFVQTHACICRENPVLIS